MKIFGLILLLALPNLLMAQNEVQAVQDPSQALTGNWMLDLRPAPDAEGYFQPFTVISINGNTFEGTFYGSPVEKGLLNRNWDRLYFAFRTRDQSNEYYHSGYLLNGTIIGTTYCPNRSFTAPWTGKKE
jgi:hypothetical protein